MVEVKPKLVDTTIPPHIANGMHGDRYGVDWIWHDDEIGELWPKSTIDALRAEVERHKSIAECEFSERELAIKQRDDAWEREAALRARADRAEGDAHRLWTTVRSAEEKLRNRGHIADADDLRELRGFATKGEG